MLPLKGKTILVVDDEEMLREILIEELTYFGATVSGAENGTVALEILQQKKFDVLISDIRMPGGDGISLLMNIKEKLAVKPKLFLCSGFSDLTVEGAKALGVIEMFPKPFHIDDMVQSISASLSK